uniref:Uncharacterized protein n=1 Tax=Lactuca sativa TaxID=4236 RepID=A0A9R1UZC1_LACSA|nr:hypothetical protein LSAT_V11C700351210 [Lactuca sativa]
MVCSAQLVYASYPLMSLLSSYASYTPAVYHNLRYLCRNLKSTIRWRSKASSDPYASMFSAAASIQSDSAEKNVVWFSIIEPVHDFDKMDIQEIQDKIK